MAPPSSASLIPSLDQILQFPNIPWVVVVEQGFHGPSSKTRELTPVPQRIKDKAVFHEEAEYHHDGLAQWWKIDQEKRLI